MMEWINELVRIRELDSEVVMLSYMYRYVEIMVLSPTSGFRFAKTIEILRQSGSATIFLDRIRFIADHILVFSPTGRGDDGHLDWSSKRDQTGQLGEFEHLEFWGIMEEFLHPALCISHSRLRFVRCKGHV